MGLEYNRHLDLFEKLLGEGKLPLERKLEGLPLIIEDTRDSLVRLYGTSDKPGVPRYIPRFYKEEIEAGPFSEGLKIAEDTLGQFPLNDKSGYLYHLGSWLNKSFDDSYRHEKSDLQDSAIVGVGVVIKAFEIQFGFSVGDGLGRADEGFVLSAFNEEPLIGNTSVINRLLSGKEIPSYQASLGSFVSKLSTYSSHPDALIDGASMQYKVFESLWPQISAKK